jgi:hypothetical protein
MRQLLLTTCEGPGSTGSTRAASTGVGHVVAYGRVQVEQVHVDRAMSTNWRDLPMHATPADLIARFAKAPKPLRPPRGSP